MENNYVTIYLNSAVMSYKRYNEWMYYCFIAGYLGVDCSIDASLPPVITGTRTGPVCDARGPVPCTFVSLFLTNFAFIDTFSCRFVRMTSRAI